jgi:UDP-N-acetylmuramoyl-L-alanyl-D-glutamate--2,6-diaminopimelate ligase
MSCALAELVSALPAAQTVGAVEGVVEKIEMDSRRVRPGDIFVAVRGVTTDGHRFVDAAVQAGARAVVVEHDVDVSPALRILVPDTRIALAVLADVYYGRPAGKLTLVGITGTNGKTTTAQFVASALGVAGHATGLIGTVDYRIGDEVFEAPHTTPFALDLHRTLARFVERGATHAVIEVSSHALDQHRAHGLRFAAAVFTNLSRDHLDYHPTMEAYREAKLTLFSGLDPASAHALVNIDDADGRYFLEATGAPKTTYGLAEEADLRARDVSVSPAGVSFDLENGGKRRRVRLSMLGRFNVHNALAAIGVARALGCSWEDAIKGVSYVAYVRGRMQPVDVGQPFRVVVDYAHTPDSLRRLLESAREFTPGKLVCVFGCGGDRDRGKRPQMGGMVGELADLPIVTSDNPRTEDPDAIIAEILTGMPEGGKRIVEVDRRRAIRMAVGSAGEGDTVVVAGKGHENYQILGVVKHHFDDAEEIAEALRGLGYGKKT